MVLLPKRINHNVLGYIKTCYRKQIYLSTKFTGTFSTFTSAGHVRRGLSNSGFSVSKVAGFGNKKESLIGIKNRH